MGAEQTTVAYGYIAFQLAVILVQSGLSVYLAQKVGLRKRWGLIGFPTLVITAQLFKLVSPALRFLEPLVTSIVQPIGEAGVLGVFVVVTVVVMLISVAAVYGIFKVLKKKGLN